MRSYGGIALVVALLACVPLLTASNVVLNFMVVALLIALVGQGWNVLGGYGGQYSFGHAAFFGTGAYVTAILQVRYGVNAWLGLVIGIAAGALVGAVTGALSFRSGLRGSYFALVTLAFAEVLRIVASVAPITGAGVGTLVKLDLRWEAFQFQSRAPFYWIILAFVAVSLLTVKLIEGSRFGAYLVAVRENEDAAKAVGIDVVRVKLTAMILSAAITAAGGCFYAQYFLFLDAGIAYGPWISVEALLAPIIGGIGTIYGPLLGALVVKSLGEITKLMTGHAPGLDLVIYGAVLILVVAYAPRGIAGLLRRRTCVHGGRGPDRRAGRPQRRRQDDAVRDHHGVPQADRRSRVLSGCRDHRRAPASAGAARHRAHVPDRATVHRPHGAREYRGRLASLAAVARGCTRGGRGGCEGRRPRADARHARRKPHGRGAQAAGACARAGDRTEAAAARRSARRPQPVRAA